ncbi:MAG: cobalt-precorrin-6A reductase [Alsobacter sp.]
MRMRVLVLGGTTEAATLAGLLAHREDIDTMLSLAGRTSAPVRPPVPYRIGGFGGVAGLVAFLRDNAIDALVDATHPFATQMSAHAVQACRESGTPLLVLGRPAWQAGAGDCWTEVANAAEAARALGTEPRTVFLTVGRLSLPAFVAAPQHRYVVRSIDRPEGLDALPSHRLVLARGPFDLAAERALMREEEVDVVVTKNSGGAATGAKLAAARELGLPVVVIRRPAASGAPEVHDPQAALAWLDTLLGAHRAPP